MSNGRLCFFAGHIGEFRHLGLSDVYQTERCIAQLALTGV